MTRHNRRSSLVGLGLFTLTLLGYCALPHSSVAQGDPSSSLVAHYTFNGNATDSTGRNPNFELKNTEFIDNALYLNGVYEGYDSPKTKGYRAVASISGLSYETFSIALRFKLATPSAGASQPNVITGGTSYRWFGVRLSKSGGGKFIVYFNNGDFAQRVEGTEIQANEWVDLACTVNLAAHQVLVYRDGRQIGSIDLPRDFILDVAVENAVDSQWSFTNYGNADTFHGWVDDFALYGRVLSPEEIASLRR